jgi:adenine-specific DNA-methyltransferase
MLEYEKKLKGVFFTSSDVAHYLTERVIENNNQKILEPSFGDGSFIDALIDHYYAMGWEKNFKDNLYAVEIRESAISQYYDNPLFDNRKLITGDFMAIEPFPVDVVIGNPPYIGLNKISVPEREKSLKLLSSYGFNMQSSGSLWLPFIMHSCEFLKNSGAIAFVLPYEITYVRYSKQLWKYLRRHFSELSVIRVYEDIFPHVDVETVLFIAKGFGGSTNFVNYELYNSRTDLFNGIMTKQVDISIESILNGERPFVSNLLDKQHLNIINKLRSSNTIMPISEFCKFKIGYVSADQAYFHPTDTEARYFNISDDELIPSIASAKVLKKNIGLEIKSNQVHTKLFYPNVSETEHPYIKHGENQSVHKRYKCSQRKPWYITPSIEIPDVVLTVFGDKPRMYINSGKYLASNSLLCGFLKPNTFSPEQVALSWYNSLTLLSIELKVHSLGGGVLVFIPGETDNIEVIDPANFSNINCNYFTEIDYLLQNYSLEKAYSYGDKYLLNNIGLSQEEIFLIQEAVQILRKWRNSRLRKSIFN